MDQRTASGVSGHGLFYPEFSWFRLLMRWGANGQEGGASAYLSRIKLFERTLYREVTGECNQWEYCDHSDMTMIGLVRVGRELFKRHMGLDGGGSGRR